MSIELRPIDGGRGGIEAVGYGRIAHTDPRPELGQVGPLMLCTVAYARELAEHGPLPDVRCGQTRCSVERAGDLWQARIEWRGHTWVWDLHPAHWWDHNGPEILLGVAPAKNMAPRPRHRARRRGPAKVSPDLRKRRTAEG